MQHLDGQRRSFQLEQALEGRVDADRSTGGDDPEPGRELFSGLDPEARALLVTGNVQDLEDVEGTWGVPLLAKPYRAQELQTILTELILAQREPG